MNSNLHLYKTYCFSTELISETSESETTYRIMVYDSVRRQFYSRVLTYNDFKEITNFFSLHELASIFDYVFKKEEARNKQKGKINDQSNYKLDCTNNKGDKLILSISANLFIKYINFDIELSNVGAQFQHKIKNVFEEFKTEMKGMVLGTIDSSSESKQTRPIESTHPETVGKTIDIIPTDIQSTDKNTSINTDMLATAMENIFGKYSMMMLSDIVDSQNEIMKESNILTFYLENKIGSMEQKHSCKKKLNKNCIKLLKYFSSDDEEDDSDHDINDVYSNVTNDNNRNLESSDVDEDDENNTNDADDTDDTDDDMDQIDMYTFCVNQIRKNIRKTESENSSEDDSQEIINSNEEESYDNYNDSDNDSDEESETEITDSNSEKNQNYHAHKNLNSEYRMYLGRHRRN
jgi:hypothetical protein